MTPLDMKVLGKLVKRPTCASVLAKMLHEPFTSVVSSLAKLANAGFTHESKWGRERVFTVTEPVHEIVSGRDVEKAQRVLQNALRLQKQDPEMDKEIALVKSVCQSGFSLVAGERLETLVSSHLYPNGSGIERVSGSIYTVWAFLPPPRFSLSQIVGRGPNYVERGKRMWKASRKQLLAWLRERVPEPYDYITGLNYLTGLSTK